MTFVLIEQWQKMSFQIRTLYFMDLFSKELQKIFCPHLILPVFQLAEVIANEVVGSRSLSDLYHLRFVSFILNKREAEVDYLLIVQQKVTRLSVSC